MLIELTDTLYSKCFSNPREELQLITSIAKKNSIKIINTVYINMIKKNRVLLINNFQRYFKEQRWLILWAFQRRLEEDYNIVQRRFEDYSKFIWKKISKYNSKYIRGRIFFENYRISLKKAYYTIFFDIYCVLHDNYELLIRFNIYLKYIIDF